jgi:hypothetical protein
MVSQNTTLAIADFGAMASEPRHQYEYIDGKELASRCNLPESWIRERLRSRSTYTLPHVRLANTFGFAGVVWNSAHRWKKPMFVPQGSCYD